VCVFFAFAKRVRVEYEGRASELIIPFFFPTETESGDKDFVFLAVQKRL
jgi:hypothetical protein